MPVEDALVVVAMTARCARVCLLVLWNLVVRARMVVISERLKSRGSLKAEETPRTQSCKFEGESKWFYNKLELLKKMKKRGKLLGEEW